MASSSQGLRIGLQIVLFIAIIGLAYWLYLSITEPYEVVRQQRVITEATRGRMDQVRQVLTRYQLQNNRFPSTLDSVVVYARQLNVDSLFGPGFVVDSLPYSPRTGKRFEYAVNDTGRVKIYLLKDPDSDDQIGSAVPDVTLINAASWE